MKPTSKRHVILAVVVILMGMVLSSAGLIATIDSQAFFGGLVVNLWNFSIIVLQYLGTFRYRVHAAFLVSLQLLFMACLLGLLICLMLVASAITLRPEDLVEFGLILLSLVGVLALLGIAAGSNWRLATRLAEAEEQGKLNLEKQGLTLREIFGAILVIGVILAPVSFYVNLGRP